MIKINITKIIRSTIVIFLVLFIVLGAYKLFKLVDDQLTLKTIINRLQADSRVAEVLVTDVSQESTGKINTTIKFLEYSSVGQPLIPLYCTFSGNIIQFQALVIRFDDFFIRKGHRLRGKSAYLFLNAFVLDGLKTKVVRINEVGQIPEGYKIKGNSFEKKLWGRFWRYAFSERSAKNAGIKNVQIEAPGTKFIPGYLYTIRIEHDGGLRIDTKKLPAILNGEKINF